VIGILYSIAACEGNLRFPSHSLPNRPHVAETTGNGGFNIFLYLRFVLVPTPVNQK
jgi:hypothetical protein